MREAANEGVFTPSSHLRYHIQFPGAWGGANWGSTAADPATGMLFVRSLEMPSYRRMSLDMPRAAGGARADRASSKASPSTRSTAPACHGPGQTPMRSPAQLGADRFRTLLRQGGEQMPAFSGDRRCRRTSVDALEAYLLSLPVTTTRARRWRCCVCRRTRTAIRVRRRATRGSFSAGWYTSNGLSGRRAAVDAAGRLRSQRRHDQVARAGRTRAGTCRARAS